MSAACTDWTTPVLQSCEVVERAATIIACGAPRMRLRNVRHAAGASASTTVAPSTTSTTSVVDMIPAPYPLASCVGDNQRRVSGEAITRQGRRAQPVADAPIEGLLARTED